MGSEEFDPILGVFYKPTPFIQQPNNIQNFNRYSYVLNNPLNATDPSGYFFQMLAMWAAARQWQTLPEGWRRGLPRGRYLTA
ncbi:hypothetical protein AEST_02720 [Alishewanella aestuarii B11]|uniref:RHS repeat-associated core domain-containing protein n=1 Tax=Alishewanella aestuarii B11 TaxID=1197174 RepID=J1QM84_9ALTE|nr:hypothetical protein AEST_02720 [Alishewanella aestuarii B11]